MSFSLIAATPCRMTQLISRSLNALLIACALSLLLTALMVKASDTNNDDYKIKVDYLYNFTKFITWTKDNITTFNICILGNDPFGTELDSIEHNKVLGRPIKLIRTTEFSDNPHCHIIYLAKNAPLIKPAYNTLVVTETEDFKKNNSMIAFIPHNNTVRLQINLHNLNHSGLQISAKLLEVAQTLIRVK